MDSTPEPKKIGQNPFNGCDDIEWLKHFQEHCEACIPEDEQLQIFNKQIIRDTANRIKELEQH